MEMTILPNGLRVVSVPLHDTKAVTVFVFAKVGSRYEPKAINGSSHFIEHLMFKGTTKRPNTLAISKELDGVGAKYNAFTSKDWTGYYVKINATHADLAVDIVSDMVQHSLFDPKEIERERGVIIEEINMYEDNPLMAIDDLFETTIFGDRHPMGWNIAGPREVIRRVTRDEMIAYRDRFYHAGNMLVVVAGHISPRMMRTISSSFRKLPSRKHTPQAKPYVAPKTMPAVRLRQKPGEQVQLALGTLAYRYTDPRLPALNLLSIILGGNMSSRLFIQVRERRGLAYSVNASVNPYEDTGAFMIHAGLEKTRVDEALTVILAEMKKLKTTRVPGPELQRAKEFVRGKMVLDFEDSDAIASWYGQQTLFHPKARTPEEAMAKVDAVSAKDIQRVAAHLFRRNALRLAIIGPFSSPKHFDAILKSF